MSTDSGKLSEFGPPPGLAVELTQVSYLDAAQCAKRYGFSARHWTRLVDTGKAPQPTRFGRLARWAVTELDLWERDGCKRCDRRPRR